MIKLRKYLINEMNGIFNLVSHLLSWVSLTLLLSESGTLLIILLLIKQSH